MRPDENTYLILYLEYEIDYSENTFVDETTHMSSFFIQPHLLPGGPGRIL